MASKNDFYTNPYSCLVLPSAKIVFYFFLLTLVKPNALLLFPVLIFLIRKNIKEFLAPIIIFSIFLFFYYLPYAIDPMLGTSKGHISFDYTVVASVPVFTIRIGI